MSYLSGEDVKRHLRLSDRGLLSTGTDGDLVIRIAEGKYLMLLYALHDKRGTPNVDKKEPGRTMCPACDFKPGCVEAGTVEKIA